MKQYPILLLILSLVFSNAKGGGGTPNIQAVCKITLTNGNSIEGLIPLGYGTNSGNWMNGFYIEQYLQDKYKIEQYFLLTLEFKSFSKRDNTYEFLGNNYEEVRKIKYLEWIYHPSILEIQKSFYDNQDVTDSFHITTHIERKYLALDSLPVYFEITSYTYLFKGENVKYKNVAVKDISNIELLDHPAQKWINIIASANKKAQELYNGIESSGDFMKATWYHEILENKEWFDELQKGIDYNVKR